MRFPAVARLLGLAATCRAALVNLDLDQQIGPEVELNRPDGSKIGPRSVPTFMPIPAWHATYHDGEVFPECDCKCCTAEPCPCLPGDTACKKDVLCMTDKRQECEQWVGENMEVTYCNINRIWQKWRNAMPHDDRFKDYRDREKHDIFCRDFCYSELPLDGAACLNVEPPERTTRKPCPSYCPPCPTNTTAMEAAGVVLLAKDRHLRSTEQLEADQLAECDYSCCGL